MRFTFSFLAGALDGREVLFLSPFRAVLGAIHVQVTDRPSPDAPSLTQTNNCANGLLLKWSIERDGRRGALRAPPSPPILPRIPVLHGTPFLKVSWQRALAGKKGLALTQLNKTPLRISGQLVKTSFTST